MKQSSSKSLKLLQFNCNGVRGKFDQIVQFMNEQNCKIGALQETHPKPVQKLNVKNFDVICRDRLKDKGGGVAFLVHKDVRYRRIDTKYDDFLEALVIAVTMVNEIRLANVCIPSSTSCAPNYKPDLSPLLDMEYVMVCGCFNAHTNCGTQTSQKTQEAISYQSSLRTPAWSP